MSYSQHISVLLIEDKGADPAWVERALERLEGFRLEYLREETVEQALSVLEGRTVDVILLDLTLSDSHGLNAFHRIQAMAPETPIVVLCGTGGEDFAAEAVQQGAKDYLVKGQVDQRSLHRSVAYCFERARSERYLTHLVNHDQLTGLPNRRLFFDRFGQALKRARRSEEGVALLVVDLDHFKDINDSLGHHAGDLVLKRAADRLRTCMREYDTVARMGGDEFALILEDHVGGSQAHAIARRVLHLLAEPFSLDDREVFISASIGVTLFPFDDHGEDVLLQHADIAMYQAKRHGGNNVQNYLGGMGAKVASRSSLVNDLHRGLDNEEFYLEYQPIVDLRNGQLTAMESLVRWNHPTRGIVSPAEFIPLAEEVGLIGALGKWVLRQACAEVSQLQREERQEFPVAVNVSTRQFRQKDLVEHISQALTDSSLDPSCLELELTENFFMEDTQQSRSSLEKIKAMGIRISLDDFGTGYSSLQYLKTFPIDTLKIDRSFVQDIDTNSTNASLVVSMIGIGHGLGLKVLAEGVETYKQVLFLQSHGCDYAQGFYFSRPQPLKSLLPFMEGTSIPLSASH